MSADPPTARAVAVELVDSSRDPAFLQATIESIGERALNGRDDAVEVVDFLGSVLVKVLAVFGSVTQLLREDGVDVDPVIQLVLEGLPYTDAE